MTFTQIKYFIEVAKCLNFTEAASHLFVTQPTLSRQIAAIEYELNMQLFIRGNKQLRLTPAGMVVYDGFKKMIKDYDNIVEKAYEASYGMIGDLKIGIIDGFDISHILPGFIKYLGENFPNIKVHLFRCSYSELIEKMYDCSLDAIITYDFDTKYRAGIQYKNIKLLHPQLVVPASHPLAVNDTLTPADLKNISLVIVNISECESGVNFVKNCIYEHGGFYPNFFYVETMQDVMLWVESGLQCALLNDGMSIVHSDVVKALNIPVFPPMNAAIAWNPQNTNFALPILTEFFNDYIDSDIV